MDVAINMAVEIVRETYCDACKQTDCCGCKLKGMIDRIQNIGEECETCKITEGE